MNGAERIAAERQRQIDAEGYTPEHDTEHADDALARAAACYATPPDQRTALVRGGRVAPYPKGWPWHPDDWKSSPDDRIRELEKAGALIAAEIDRLLAAAGTGGAR